MRKITVEGIEINFNDLTEQKQNELYQKNYKKYKEDASKSTYSAIRKKVVLDESESSEFLNRMLRNELNGQNDKDIINEIFKNDIFEIEKESIIALSTSEYWLNRERAVKLSKDSSFLNQMLRNEVKYFSSNTVYNAIFENDIFEIEEETIETLALSEMPGYRLDAARLSKDSKLLNQMLINEEEGDQNQSVENAIIDNKVFKIEERTLKCLAKSDDWRNRLKAAKLSKDSKFLNKMLEAEVEEELNDEDVINEIFDNEFFEIEEETLEVLKTSDYEERRQKAAELLKDSNELIEMFINELKEEYPSSEVLEAIFENESFVFEKAALLEYIRDN